MIVYQAVGFGLVTAAILALSAVGFTLQFGVTNVFNLSYGALMSVAVFIAYWLGNAGVSIWFGLVASGLCIAILSVGLNRFLYTPFIRRRENYVEAIIVSAMVALMIENVLLGLAGASAFSYPTSNPSVFHVIGLIFTSTQIEVIGLALGAMLLVHLLLTSTRVGKAMRAAAGNPSLAKSCGIPTDRVTDLAWAFSGFLCGVSGVAFVMTITSFTTTTGADLLIPVIAAAVLGGIGQAYGAMLGALTVGLVTEVSASLLNPEYKEVIAFGILVVVLLLRPAGILSGVARQKGIVA